MVLGKEKTERSLVKFYFSGGELLVTEAMYWVVALAYVEEVPLDELVLCAREQGYIL